MSALALSKEYLLQNDEPFHRQWAQSYNRNHGKPLRRVFTAQGRHTLSADLSPEFSTVGTQFFLPSVLGQCLPQNRLQNEKTSKRTRSSILSLQNCRGALQKCKAKGNLNLSSLLHSSLLSSPPAWTVCFPFHSLQTLLLFFLSLKNIYWLLAYVSKLIYYLLLKDLMRV